MTPAFRLSCWLALAGPIASPVTLAASDQNNIMRIELPLESGTFRSGEGADLANAFCLTCHSVEYVSTQPPLRAAAWKLIVGKMIAKFGAPVPPTKVDPIVAYLAQTYGGASWPAK